MKKIDEILYGAINTFSFKKALRQHIEGMKKELKKTPYSEGLLSNSYCANIYKDGYIKFADDLIQSLYEDK